MFIASSRNDNIPVWLNLVVNGAILYYTLKIVDLNARRLQSSYRANDIMLDINNTVKNIERK